MEDKIELGYTIKDLLAINAEKLIDRRNITICGWVQTCRTQQKGKLLFIQLQDGSTQQHIQVLIFSEDYDQETFTKYTKITTGYSLQCTGNFVKCPESATGQLVELRTTNVVVLGECPTDYILQKHASKKTKGVALETLRQQPHLRCRAGLFQSVWRIRDQLMRSTHSYFGSKGFVWAATPILTFSDCEGAGETFLIKTQYPPAELPEGGFFGRECYATVSGQLEGEMLAMANGRIYTFGPTFRAEKSKTTRHLSEFWMIEPEVCFITLKELISLACGYVTKCIRDCLTERADDLKVIASALDTQSTFVQLQECISKPWTVISYTEAIDKLIEYQSNGKTFENKVEWGIDMSSEHEKFLTDTVFKCPVAVYNYPAAIKAFYMKRADDGNGKCVESFDLLVPGIGELIGGSIREDDYNKLCNVMRTRKMDLSLYTEYLDLRVFGSVPHGGFGLGFERLVQFVTGLKHIQDCIPFPRAY